jgi:hypothetical protein
MSLPDCEVETAQLAGTGVAGAKGFRVRPGLEDSRTVPIKLATPAASANDFASFVLRPKLSRSAIRMTTDVFSVRRTSCNEAAFELKLEKILHR